MGVKGLTGLLQRLAPNAVHMKHISDYRGKTLAVDVSCYLNRFIYGLDPHPARVQRGVYRLCIYLQLNGIKPVFVFDGRGRIVEKQREALRRAKLKEKVERSFKLEKARKARLRELKGSTQLLKGLSQDQVSSILKDIQLQSNSTLEESSLSQLMSSAAAEAPSLAPTSQDWKLLPHEEMLSTDQSKLAFATHDKNDPDGDFSWHIPATFSEDEERQLEAHLNITKEFYTDDASFLRSAHSWGDRSIQEIEEMRTDLFEFDLDALGRLELDLETVATVDIIHDLAEKNDYSVSSTTDDKGGDSQNMSEKRASLPSVSLAGNEFGQQSDNDQLEPSGPSYDAQVRQKVHEALGKFVRTMERSMKDGSAEEVAQNSTQKQRALSELERKLVYEIRERSRNHMPAVVAVPTETIESLGTTPLDTQPSAQPEVIEVVEQQQQQQQQQRQEELKEEQREADAEVESVTPLEEVFERSAEKPPSIDSTDTTSPESLLIDSADAVDPWPLMEKPAITVQAEPLMDAGEAASDDLQELGTVAEEAGQERDLRSTIKEVLTAHESLFITLGRRTLRVTWPLSVSCQTLLQAMGQPVVLADNAEAEAVCARLTTLGWTDGSISEDTDTTVFGNGLLLRQVAFGSTKDVIEIDPLIAHKALGVSRDAFRDLCILCGTDFSGTIEGIGPFRAASLIQRYGSIESIMANTEYRPREDFVYDNARRVFDKTPVVPDNAEAYEPSAEVQPMLQDLLLKYEIDPEEVRKELLDESDTAVLQKTIAGEQGGFGASFPTSSMGIDPFRAMNISIPDRDDSKVHSLE